MFRSEEAEGEAIDRWNRLSLGRQREAVCRLAHDLTRHWPRYFDSSVVGLGFGGRKRRMADALGRGRSVQLLHDCPALAVIVEKKIPASRIARLRNRRLVPKHIPLTLRLRGKKVIVAVPTDVVGRTPTPRAQSVEGLLMRGPNKLVLKGSVAAIVRDDPDFGERYFLTCHHVACLSLLDPNLNARLPAAASLIQDGSYIGDTEREALFGQGIGPCIDAALVRIDPDASVDEDLSLLTPITGAVNSFEQLAAERDSAGMFLFSLHKPDGLELDFQGMRVDFDVTYESGATATIVEVMEYDAMGPSTRSGDSGGTIVSGNGVFLGMHIAGAGRRGCGIPAYMLLESPAFNPPVVLA